MYANKSSLKIIKNCNLFSDNQDNSLKSNNFLNYIKYNEDSDKAILLNIQEKLEITGINKENVYLLTKNLSETQKKKLLELYRNQISSLNNNINIYKEKIIKIRKSLKS